MTTSSSMNNVLVTKQTYMDVVRAVAAHTTPVYLRQLAAAEEAELNPEEDFGGSNAAYFREELARSEAEGVPPGMLIRVPRASKGEREITDLTTEQLASNSFDWVDVGYDRYSVEIAGPDSLTVTFEVFDNFVVLSVNHSPWATGRDLQSEARWLDKIEDILRGYPAPLPPLPPFKIVMGHGNDHQWRILRDELRDHHGFSVSAFEGQPRAGETINTALEDMADKASVALIVLTKADEMADGTWRARQNVVHEVGFFQGRLGWTNAIVIVEDGVELFSNLDGTQQIRFPAGTISAATGNVAATLNAKNRQRTDQHSH